MDASLKKTGPVTWEIEKTGAMRVPAKIFASDALAEKIKQDRTLQQAANVATLKGIINHALVMPDAHEGYGFPIGGVAAFDLEEGIICPGGIG
ncbi:MAG: RtcB family protein, partial [Candidatus Aenigmarchaeota archaeon]|nr:RtcB family protein [Candidatus Aenigmarchaeota archaeon]